MYNVLFGRLIKTVCTLLVFHRLREKRADYTREAVKKILIVRKDNIGDVICTSPTIKALREHFSNSFIAILVNRLTEEVVKGNSWLNKVYVYDKSKHQKTYRGHLLSLWRLARVIGAIRKEGFDLAIGVQSQFSASLAWLVYASKAPVRLGHKPKGGKAYLSFFYTMYVPAKEGEVHEVERSLNIVRTIGVDTDEKDLFFPVSEGDRGRGKAFLESQGLLKRPLVAVNFNARMEEDRWWPTENYFELLSRLSARDDIGIIFTFARGDQEKAGEIIRACKDTVPWFCSPTLGRAPLCSQKGGSRQLGYCGRCYGCC